MSQPVLLSETERFLHEQIPLSKTMGVRIESFDGHELVVTAPLEPNHNHLGTAFGGSLAAIATLAGYSLLWLLLDDRSCHIVIRESSISYRHPVDGPIRAFSRSPEPAAFGRFRARFEKSGKSRITLRSTIEQGGVACVVFEGVFVALRG